MYCIGLDLGKRVDYAADAVVERVDRKVEGFDYVKWASTARALPDLWVVRRVERAPLGLPYNKIIERVAALTGHPKLAGNCRLAVDATGLGAPMVDMLRAADLGCEVTPIVLTGGMEQHFDGRAWHVPKVDLLGRVQMLLEQERLRIAKKARDREGLVKELLDIRGRQMGRGHVRVGAEGNGQHDDLVTAVALAVWLGQGRDRKMAGYGPGRVV